MSSVPRRCEPCHAERVVDGVSPFLPEGETLYGVSWRCPTCGELALDVCPLGPIVPGADACLNCGAEVQGLRGGAVCAGCGMTAAQAEDFLRVVPEAADPLARTQELFSRGLVRCGLACLNRALQRDPAQEAVWEMKADFYERLGFHDAAAVAFERALQSGGDVLLHARIGYSHQQKGRHREAVAAYRAYLAAAPEGERASIAHCNQANSLRELGELDAAEDAYREALVLDPTQPTHSFAFADHLSRMERWQEAVEALEAGLPHAAEPGLRGRMQGLLAVCYAELEQGEPAVAAAEAALAAAPDDVGARYTRGRALALVGRLQDAREDMAQVLVQVPDHPDARRALGMIDDALGSPPPPAAPTSGAGPSRPWWRFWQR